MLEEICIRRRAGCKFESGSVLHGRWSILSSLSHCNGQVSDGCFNRGIKLVQESSSRQLGVLKMLPPDICCIGHAEREIRILRRLTQYGGGGHANVVRLLDFDDGSKHPHDIPWMVTQLADRGTLAQLVDDYTNRGLPLPEAFLWHAFESLVEAVRFCHSQGVVHRDITLNNVFLQSCAGGEMYPRVQLGDFGCAMTRDDYSQRSLGNVIPGNPRFMPPEGCKEKAACDIYQVGLVALCLYMRDSNPTEGLADFLNEPETHGQQRSRELKNLIAWCLIKEAEQRPSGEVLVTRIQKIITERGSIGRPPVFESLIELRKETRFDLDSATRTGGLECQHYSVPAHCLVAP